MTKPNAVRRPWKEKVVMRIIDPVTHQRRRHFVAEDAADEMLAALTAFLAPYRD